MNKVDKIVKILNKKYGISAVDWAIVAGSGLIEAVPEMKDVMKVDYKTLGLPKSKVKGHGGGFIFGKINNKNVVVVSRMHYYESGDLSKVRLPLEIVSKLGVKSIILMTSCGGLNKGFRVGDVMLIEDHINMSGVNPLVAVEDLSFTNMVNCYDLKYREQIKKLAKENKIDIRAGVFCQMCGPSYETSAEVQMLRMLGADSVSMSTAHDCIIANYLGMRVIGISVIVNVFNDGSDAKLNHEEVLENASRACAKVRDLLVQVI